jgi:hypothetical protein
MESIVQCPGCGADVPIVLNPYMQELTGLTEMLEKYISIGKSAHFEGSGKCACGKAVIASLHVTVEA